MTSLPVQMIQDIQALGLSKANYNSAIRFVDLLKSKSFRNYKVYDSGVQLPNTYLGKVFSNHLYEWLTPLKDSGVVQLLTDEQGNELYSKTKHIPKTYNLNSTYFTYTSSTYSLNTYKSPAFEESEQYQGFQSYKELVSEDLKNLTFNFKKLREIASQKINSITVDSYKTGTSITQEFFQVTIKKKKQYTYWMTKDNALRIAAEENLTLIQDQKKFWLANLEEFVTMKKNVFTDAYMGSIDKIEKGYWYADRNCTNNRLDSNITNLCSDLTKEIIESNNLVQFDLANSQFAILSHILKQKEEIATKEDFLKFKELSETGELYEYIQEVLSLDIEENKKKSMSEEDIKKAQRKKAKIMLFELLFSSEKNKSENKKKIAHLFPSVVKWIDDYKKLNGYENFAVMLQLEESRIFIDDIYHSLKEKEMFCLTKHDSIIVRKEDEEEVETFLKEYFDSINFIAKLVK